MNVTNLDAIVKGILLRRGYSLHWYLQFLLYAKDCLAELSLDEDIQTIRYKVCTLNSNHAIDLPSDYVDWANVSARIGQYLHPLIEDRSLSLVPNYDADLDIQPYSSGISSLTTAEQLDGYYGPYWWFGSINQYGQNLGGWFGGVGGMSDTFKENKARGEIKINENLGHTQYVLEYAGDGTDADSATHINVYAAATIRRYCMWQFYLNNRTYSQREAVSEEMGYLAERQRLRARLSDITIDLLRRIVQRNTVGIKY